jgi:CheY-like chemotaxis protein
MLTLVVDDDPGVRGYLGALLRSENLETLVAADGLQALEVLKRLDRNVDLIISDIDMPGLDGVRFANTVRASSPDVPIILMSGNGQAGVPFEFVEKPFSRATMVGTVRRLMAQRV